MIILCPEPPEIPAEALESGDIMVGLPSTHAIQYRAQDWWDCSTAELVQVLVHDDLSRYMEEGQNMITTRFGSKQDNTPSSTMVIEDRE